MPGGPGVIKAQVLDEAALERALTRISHEILERNGGAADLEIGRAHV